MGSRSLGTEPQGQGNLNTYIFVESLNLVLCKCMRINKRKYKSQDLHFFKRVTSLPRTIVLLILMLRSRITSSEKSNRLYLW
jgi:hypothetical protein